MILYFVRHAEPIKKKNQNDKEKFEVGLSSFGRLQAGAVAKALRRLGVERIYSSLIARARETAEIISLETGLSVEYDKRLEEFTPNPFSKNPIEQKQSKLDSYSHPNKVMPGGESLNDGVKRLEFFIEDLKEAKTGPICLVTHRIILEGFLAKNFGIKTNTHEWLQPASVTAINIDLNGNLKLIFFDKKYIDFKLFIKTLARYLLFL